MAKLIDVHELSEELGETEDTVRKWMRGRKIPFMKIGTRTVRFDLEKADF